jgi:predicted metal-dependent peptidase
MTLDSHEGWGQAGDEADEELARSTMEKMIKDAMDKSRGNLPSNISELLDLWTKKAKISWKRVLKKIVSSKKGSKIQTIKRRDRRQPQRKDIKGKKTFYDQPNVIAIVDISGSMGDEEIFEGLSEIAEVCRVTGSNLKLIQVDTAASEIEDFDPKKKTWERKGCGGTYIAEGIKKAMDEKLPSDVAIVITDAYIEDVTTDQYWNKYKKPVLWLLPTGAAQNFEVLKHHKVFRLQDA